MGTPLVPARRTAAPPAAGHIELNEQFTRALDVLERTNQSAFITGRAGTGKSTLLTLFRDRTEKAVATVAPTGVAAVNVSGRTIHSFFKFPPSITVAEATTLARRAKRDVFRALKCLIVDEVSMVRADLLDCMDVFLREARGNRTLPFGGLQMAFFGDLYQLPPVVRSADQAEFRKAFTTPYFFSAAVMGEIAPTLALIELETVYRQKDDAFIGILNAIRNNTAGAGELALLNRRYRPDATARASGETIILTALNAQADATNGDRLAQLAGKGRTYRGTIEGQFPSGELPTDEALTLKRGARVMLLSNDSRRRWINGTLATVDALMGDTAAVRLDSGRRCEVEPHTWNLYESRFDGAAKGLTAEPVGSFTQLPLRLAWAITIHKSQGKTFDRVVVDLGRGAFAEGQVYVALSRCRTLEGISLARPLEPRHVRVHYGVMKFLTQFQYARARETLGAPALERLITEAIARRQPLTITYLKAKDVKSTRTIEPRKMERMAYEGHEFLGLVAYCRLRKAERVFNVERILDARPA